MTFSRYEGLDAMRVLSSLGVVFLHVHASAGLSGSLEWLMKLRDFALPVMVLSSFFLLARALMKRREAGFAGFFNRRVERLWLPLIIWTFVYCSMAAFVFPVWFGAGGSGEFPSAWVFLTGYRHLWFLQFVFVASLVLYPLIYSLTDERKSPPARLALFCFAAAAVYLLLYHSFIKNYAVWDDFDSEAGISFGILISQAGSHIFYIPVAVGLALVSDKIRDLFARAAVRRFSLAAALLALTVHLTANGAGFTREFYGIAIFLAALQPWAKIPFPFARTLAAYSYGIYILHFLPAQILWYLVEQKYFEPGAATVLVFTLIIYLISFAAAFFIRKLFPVGWLMPLADKRAEKTSAEPARVIFPLPAAGGNADSPSRI